MTTDRANSLGAIYVDTRWYEPRVCATAASTAAIELPRTEPLTHRWRTAASTLDSGHRRQGAPSVNSV